MMIAAIEFFGGLCVIAFLIASFGAIVITAVAGLYYAYKSFKEEYLDEN